jgi:hypothetical protein
MRVSASGFTLPWQLVAAHPPGPTYLEGSTVVPAGFLAAIDESPGAARTAGLAKIAAAMGSANIAAASRMRRKFGSRRPSGLIFIQVSITKRGASGAKSAATAATISSFAYTLRAQRSQRGFAQPSRAVTSLAAPK